MSITRKNFGHISIIYGIIISIINYLGFLMANSGNFPVKQTENFDNWVMYIAEHQLLINVLSAVGFVIPVILCILYTAICSKDAIKRRFINLPIAYPIIGASGWFLTFIAEAIVLFIARITDGIHTGEIMLHSALNIIQASLFIFTLSFLILYTVHTKVLMPKYFSGENIFQIKGILKPSVKFLFVVFYISVGIFPVFFFFSNLINASEYYGFEIKMGTFLVSFFIVFCGFIMLITFANIFDYPLKKFKEGTEKIKEGNYTDKLKIVSNDAFGELTYTFNDMTSALDEKTRKILEIQNSVIRGMAVMVESRDNSTGGHINRTSDCVKIFVDKMKTDEKYSNLSDEFFESVIKAAPMHDLGKIAVDDSILRKPGKFTDEEYEIMKKHSAEGARIVENVLREVDNQNFKSIAINVAHYHHEKWDGAGYPEKLSGESIPLEARIMALADVFDALVSKRCYKESFTYDRAFSIIQDSLGTHFDPVLGAIFIRCRKELEELYNNY